MLYRESRNNLLASRATIRISSLQPSVPPTITGANALVATRNRSCTLPLRLRLQQTSPDDCVECHMPKARAQRLIHTVVTDHRIIVRKDEPYLSFPSYLGISRVAGLIWLDAVPGKNSPLSGIGGTGTGG
jgi:hypothetical protein